MPELPEVETIKRIIEPQLAGRQIESVNILNSQIIAYPSADEFAVACPGKTIKAMSRRGKFLTIHFEDGSRVSLHLRMTGQLLVMPDDYPVEKHTHLIMNLSDGKQLRYIDVRRFGRFWYFESNEEDTITGMDKLGTEPDNPVLTGAYLMDRLGRKKKAIKEMLLDQSVVAGIGNIYSDEILYASEVYPEIKCAELTKEAWDTIAANIKKVIALGIDLNKMTPEEYLEGKGKEYRNTPFLKVYGHEGKQCEKCESTFEKITIGGRSSCFCPVCQRRP